VSYEPKKIKKDFPQTLKTKCSSRRLYLALSGLIIFFGLLTQGGAALALGYQILPLQG
jgi:hypothetical protein